METGRLKELVFWDVIRDDGEVFEFRTTSEPRKLMGFLVALMGILVVTLGGIAIESLTRMKTVQCSVRDDGSRICELRDSSVYGMDVRESVEISDVEFVKGDSSGDSGSVHLMTGETSHSFPVFGAPEAVERRIGQIRSFAKGDSSDSIQYAFSPGGRRNIGEIIFGFTMLAFIAGIGFMALFRMRWMQCRLSRIDGTIRIEHANLFANGSIERPLEEIEDISMEPNIDPDRVTSLLGTEQSVDRRLDRLFSQFSQNNDPIHTKYRVLVEFTDGTEVALNYVFDAEYADSEPIVERMRQFLAEDPDANISW